MRYTRVCLLLVLVFFTPGALYGQDATVTTAAPIYLLPDSARIPLRTAAVNTRLRVLEEGPEGWLKVEFRDPQFGMRLGYVEARFVRVHRPELEPMDLSVKRDSGAFVAPPGAAPAQPPAPVSPPARPAYAPPGFARGWIDVNVGVAVAADGRYGAIYEPVLFGERATVTADYRAPAGADFDFGGGVMFTPSFGLGVSFAGTAHQDHAQLGIRIPHPFSPNAHATDSAPTDVKLARVDSAAHIQAVFAGHPSERMTVRVFAGPSYFRLRQEAVGFVRFDQAFLIFSPGNAVEITGYESSRIDFDDSGGWGFNLGADVSVFFTRVVGLGAFARVARGTVEVVDPLSASLMDLTTGGFQAGGGLRLRF